MGCGRSAVQAVGAGGLLAKGEKLLLPDGDGGHSFLLFDAGNLQLVTSTVVTGLTFFRQGPSAYIKDEGSEKVIKVHEADLSAIQAFCRSANVVVEVKQAKQGQAGNNEKTSETDAKAKSLRFYAEKVQQCVDVLVKQIGAAGKIDKDCFVHGLRKFRVTVGELQTTMHELFSEAVELGTHVSRAGYLRTLAEILPRPGEIQVQKWRDTFDDIRIESRRLACPDQSARQCRNYLIANKLIPLRAFLSDSDTLAYINQCMDAGCDREQAEVMTLLGRCAQPALGRALREGSCRYAAATHVLTDTLAARARAGFQGACVSAALPSFYCNLMGDGGLGEHDPVWCKLLDPDASGFRGCLSTCVAEVYQHEDAFDEEGYRNGDPEAPQDSPVVRIEVRAEDAEGLHSPAMACALVGLFPPNTLFKVRSVQDPPFVGPNGVVVDQKLITVSATYKMSMTSTIFGDGGKLCSRPITLSYSSREAYIRGINDITARPVLTMSQEFDRDVSWADWKGVEYTLRSEWAYVMGKAKKKRGCTPGVRDEHNDGKSPMVFLRDINAFIKKRRSQGFDGGVPEYAACLTMEEVLGLRLYSGPAYQMLNQFLREISKNSGEFRMALANDVQLTFTATVRHIRTAITKLAAVVTDAEAKQKLYRGVRGSLPEEFWLPDAVGIVCATDVAFMSTSKNRHTPVDYMGPGPNVLWEMEISRPTDTGFHRGADISMISQFAGEDEVLFPPNTFLVVKKDNAAKLPRAGLKVTETSSGNKSCLTIHVTPTFT